MSIETRHVYGNSLSNKGLHKRVGTPNKLGRIRLETPFFKTGSYWIGMDWTGPDWTRGRLSNCIRLVDWDRGLELGR